MTPHLASLNSQKSAAAQSSGSGCALSLSAEGQAPEWIMLFPAGRLVVGRDKRKYTVDDPEAVVAATKSLLPLPVDYEHDYERRKPGDDTPAAGWIEELAVRDGAIWGRVVWTPKAAAAIAGREYRFISPGFMHTDDDAAALIELISAGLVHRPNFVMPALNSKQKDPVMDKELAKALGLPEAASVADAIVAVAALQTPPLTKFMPRADYDQAVTRALNAEQELSGLKAAQTKRDAEALVDKAIAERKIAPASRDHYLKLAVSSRADVEALLASTPAIIPEGEDKDLAKGEADKNSGALSDAEKAMCSQLGIAEDKFIKARG